MYDAMPWATTAALNLLRVLSVIAFLYILVPAALFPYRAEPGASAWVQRAIWMFFASTVVVHILVVAQLYEAIAFLVVVFAATIWLRRVNLSDEAMGRIRASLIGWLLDLLDRRGWRRGGARPEPRPTAPRPTPGGGRWPWLAMALLLTVLAVAGWVRFGQAFETPAPALSDAPVTLAWLKYAEAGDLYGDGVYPRGLYAYFTLLRKFTAMNAVEVIVAAGPLNSLVLVASLAFFVFRMTGSWTGAIIAALIYGTFPQALPLDPHRQAGYNSEEFGNIFVLPAAWYAYAYLARGRPADRFTAAAAAGMTAFVHPVPVMFAITAMAGTSLTALIGYGAAAWRRLPSLVGWTALFGAIAVLPMVIALALGTPWHGTSLNYLNKSVSELGPVPLVITVSGAVAAGTGAALALVGLLLGRWWRGSGPFNPWVSRAAVAVVVGLSGLFVLSPLAGLDIRFLYDRGREMTALGLAAGAGLLWSVLAAPLTRFRAVTTLLVAALVAGGWYLWPPQVIRPYLYYTDEQILQYLRADATFTPGTWTLVMGFTGYPLALGRGYHMEPDGFIAMANRMPADPGRWIKTGEEGNIGVTTRYLLVVEKVVPIAPFQPLVEGRPRLEAAHRLDQWIAAHTDRLPLTRWWDGDEVAVWELRLPEPERNPYDIFRTQPSAPPGPLGR